MGRGKIAVQCSHAAVSAAEKTRAQYPDWWNNWIEEGQCKIALKVSHIETIMNLARLARSRRIPISLVRDKGLTQITPGTVTCLGIGPAPREAVDALTGDLPLL